MADEKKKPKIDIKARLGKTAVGMQGGSSVPLPMPGPGAGSAPPPSSDPGRSSGSIPTPSPSVKPIGIAPPASISPGIPLPPFGQQPARRAPEPKPVAQAQTIKVEIGEEVEAERKKASKKAVVYAVIAAVAGAGIGFVWGGASKTGDITKRAQKGASELESSVKAANEKLHELSDKIDAGAEQLSQKKYPDDLAQALGGITVPFDATYLDGKGVGNYNGALQKKVFMFTQAVTDLNNTKQTLTNLLSAAKKPVEKAWAEEKEPVANFSVTFRADNKGMLAELVANKDPFPYGKDWPDSWTILRPERTQNGTKTVEKKANRWKKGDLTATDPIVIPVEASSVAAFTSEQLIYKLAGAVRDIREVLEGKKDDPTNPTNGLIKDGEDLAVELHKIAIAK